MANVIQVPTYEQIETILSKLATNYSNLASVFYDVFYNTTPMDVPLQMYDTSGVLQTYVIPNRAKDMKNMLSGNGTPEGNVEAGFGVLYQDLTNGNLYVKGTSSGNEGWEEIATEDYVGAFLRQGNGTPEGTCVAGKGVLYVDLINSTLYMKTTEVGSTGWILISASTSALANRDLSNLTSEGAARFADSSLSNLSEEGRAILNGKEVISNKVTTITDASTDTQYPSAKSVYTYVDTVKSGLADRSLSNLEEDGKLKFIDWSRVKDGVLCAPKGVIYKSPSGADGVILPQSTTLLLAKGIGNSSGSDNKYLCYNHEVFTLDTSMAGTVSTGIVSGRGYIFYLNSVEYSINRVEGCEKSKFIISEQEPEVTEYQIWYNPADNWYRCVRHVDGSEDTWVLVLATCVGEFTTTDNPDGQIDELIPYYPIKLVTAPEIEHTVVEIGGTEDNWYRLYRDGWIEQGGYFTGSGPIEFAKEFSTIHYTFVPSANVTAFTKASDGVTVTVANSNVETDWIASGWTAN